MPLTATSPEVMATVVLASTLRRRIVSWSSGLFTLSLGYLGLPLAELAALCAPLVAITALSCNGCALRVNAVHPVATATFFKVLTSSSSPIGSTAPANNCGLVGRAQC
jgi:hypothetical protein